MNNIENIEDDDIFNFLKDGSAFDGYLYSMGVLLDRFKQHGMNKFTFSPFNLENIDIFKLSSDELANILISCVLTATDEAKNTFKQTNFEDINGKYLI